LLRGVTFDLNVKDGRWHLIIRRPLAPETPAGAAALAPERFGSVAFAVWDGGNPDARAVSPWIDVALPRKLRSKTVD
jgi:hypothetical protein